MGDGGLIFGLEGGESPAVLDGEEADADGDGAGEDGAALGTPAEVVEADDVDDASGEAAGGVDLLTENEGLLVDEYIAQHTASGTCDDSQTDRCPRGHSQSQRLLDTDDIEEREAYAVEDEPSIILTYKPLTEDDNPQESEETCQQEDRIFEPERSLANKQVTDGTASTSGSCSYNECTKKVELLRG